MPKRKVEMFFPRSAEVLKFETSESEIPNKERSALASAPPMQPSPTKLKTNNKKPQCVVFISMPKRNE